ncbi:MAG: hypothetical protein NTY30_02525 [Candidatus Berkelbacteria bacterium]|nr:hypothetical protein [Candidatus Berkelbacteria bacterium]
MDLNSFYQLSVSIFAIVATIFIITLFVLAIKVQIQLSRLIQKLEEISVTVKTTAGETKEFIEKTISSLEAFKQSILTFEFLRKAATEIITQIKSKSKGEKDGQED